MAEQLRAQDPSTSPSRPTAVITPFRTAERKPPAQGPTTSRRTFLKLGVVGTGLVVAEEAERQYQAISRGWGWLQQRLGWNSETPVPLTFDNTLNKGIIGDNNIIDLSPSEINQRFPNAVEEGHFLDFLSFMVLPDGTKMPYIRQDVWDIPYGANYETEELNKQARENNIKDMMEMTIPAGTILISPVDGYGFIDMGTDVINHKPGLPMSFTVVFHDEKQNKTYLIRLSGQNPRDPKNPDFNLTSLAPGLERPTGQRGGGNFNWKTWTRTARGQPLMKTTGDQSVRLSIEAYRGEKIGGTATLIDKTRYLLTPRFYTDPATGKLVALKP